MSEFTNEERRKIIDGVGGPASLAKAMDYLTLQLQKSMAAGTEEANRLAKKMWWLNLWLLAVTIAILVLTGVLVWAGLRESGAIRQHSGVSAAAMTTTREI